MVRKTEDPVTLTQEEQELVLQELQALTPSLQGHRREAYAVLAQEATQGSIPAETVPALEGLTALALQTGRARRLYHAEGERVFTDLLRRTPQGRELEQGLAQVNSALATLTGSPLRAARVAMRTLGHFTVSFETDQATVTLAVRLDGVTVESVGVAA